jgi:hypothetical protein
MMIDIISQITILKTKVIILVDFYLGIEEARSLKFIILHTFMLLL